MCVGNDSLYLIGFVSIIFLVFLALVVKWVDKCVDVSSTPE